MKRLLILMAFSLVLAVPATVAQTLLGDLLKGNTAVAGTSDSVLIDAVQPGLYVVRQQYQIRNVADGKVYGKDGNNWFGETYSLGVKVAGGLLVTRAVMRPWEGDTDFDKVNNHGKYVPQLYRTTYLRSVDGGDYREANLDFDTPEYIDVYGSDSLLFRHIESQADFGFLTDERFGTTEGYLLWAYRDSTAAHADMKVRLRVARKRLGPVADSLYVACAPVDSAKALGGVFVVPVTDRVGQVSFRLAGIALQTADGRWVLRSLTREAVSAPPVSAPDEKGRRSRDGRGAEAEEAELNLSPVAS